MIYNTITKKLHNKWKGVDFYEIKKNLNYGNSVYQIGEQINSLQRKNSKSKIKASTGAKLLITGFMYQNRSINEIIETT